VSTLHHHTEQSRAEQRQRIVIHLEEESSTVTATEQQQQQQQQQQDAEIPTQLRFSVAALAVARSHHVPIINLAATPKRST
jgi:hypothetical protein